MVDSTKYGKCRHCELEYQCPGYDHSYCLKCGWVEHFTSLGKNLDTKARSLTPAVLSRPQSRQRASCASADIPQLPFLG